MEVKLKEEQDAQRELLGVTYVSTEQDRKTFLQFLYNHYKGDTHWVPPLMMQQKELLDTKRNPFYKDAEIALFIGYIGDRPAGRIAAIHNRAYNRFQGVNVGFFGFFECEDNQSLANLLFRVTCDWLRNLGCVRILGPMNPGLLDEIGIQVDGFHRQPAIMMPHSKPWYDTLLKNAGFSKEMDLFAYKVTQENVALDRMNRAADIVSKRNPGIKIRPVNMRRFKSEIDVIHTIFNKAWEQNWGFYEQDRAIFEHLGKSLKLIIDTDVAHVAELDGKPVGFSVSLPDYNQVFRHMNGSLFPLGLFKLLWYRRKITSVRTALMGVLPEFQGRGIYALLVRETIMRGLEKGYTSSELGWLLESNASILAVVEKIGGVKEKTYRLYGQDL